MPIFKSGTDSSVITQKQWLIMMDFEVKYKTLDLYDRWWHNPSSNAQHSHTLKNYQVIECNVELQPTLKWKHQIPVLFHL